MSILCSLKLHLRHKPKTKLFLIQQLLLLGITQLFSFLDMQIELILDLIKINESSRDVWLRIGPSNKLRFEWTRLNGPKTKPSSQDNVLFLALEPKKLEVSYRSSSSGQKPGMGR